MPRDVLDLNAAVDVHHRAAHAIRSGKVFAAHDVSDGGLGVSIAEMCIASGLGATVRLPQDPYRLFLYDPFPPTYVLEMTERDAIDAGFSIIGRVTAEDRLRVDGWNAGLVDLSVEELSRAWKNPLSEGGGRVE
jgi:phosphoribosylformylglycinamidine synthase